MARSDIAAVRLADLFRQAETLVEKLDVSELLHALGDVERLRLFLRWRLRTTTALERPSADCRLDVGEIVRALCRGLPPPDQPRSRAADGLLTIPQAAQILAVSNSTIRSWLSQHRLPAVKLGRSVRIKEADVRKFIENGYVPTGTDR